MAPGYDASTGGLVLTHQGQELVLRVVGNAASRTSPGGVDYNSVLTEPAPTNDAETPDYNSVLTDAAKDKEAPNYNSVLTRRGSVYAGFDGGSAPLCLFGVRCSG